MDAREFTVFVMFSDEVSINLLVREGHIIRAPQDLQHLQGMSLQAFFREYSVIKISVPAPISLILNNFITESDEA